MTPPTAERRKKGLSCRQEGEGRNKAANNWHLDSGLKAGGKYGLIEKSAHCVWLLASRGKQKEKKKKQSKWGARNWEILYRLRQALPEAQRALGFSR